MTGDPTVELIACETCGGTTNLTPDGHTQGERLLSLLTQQAQTAPNIRVSSTRCLWACTRSCAVHLRALDGSPRVGYVIGDLAPSEEFAAALLEYAKMYADTSDGAVPLRQRPQALKGHFVCRIPAAPSATAITAPGDAAKPRV